MIEEIKLPDIIFKYRDWDDNNHKRILTDNEIYYASPYECSEAHELTLEKDYSGITEDDIYNYIYTTAPEKGYTTPEQRHEIAKIMVKKTPFHDPRYRKNIETQFKQILNKRLSVFSVSEHRDNFNLWNVFANSETGFCVGLSPDCMFHSGAIFGKAAKVKYYPAATPPKIKAALLKPFDESVEETYELIYNLPDFYSDEDEFRITKMDIPNRQIKITAECYKQIILGANISDKSRQEIIDVAKINFPDCPIYQAKFDYGADMYSFTEVK
jgi:hypothetical protein